MVGSIGRRRRVERRGRRRALGIDERRPFIVVTVGEDAHHDVRVDARATDVDGGCSLWD